MTRNLLIAGTLLLVVLLYLATWPVPVNPVAWQAPQDRGLVDPFGPDDRLKNIRRIELGEHEGPEDLTGGRDGQLYATVKDGKVVRIDGYGKVEVFAEVGGRPLGIETDSDGSFVIANAYAGLQRVLPDGSVQSMLTEVDGRPLHYANDLAIASDGVIYFTESSTKFAADQSGGTYEGSLLDILEHGGHGLLIRFDPATNKVRVLLDGLNFANGVALSSDETFLVVSDLGSYRIIKHWLQGPKAGTSEVILENLPAFADNINNGLNDRFWIGLIAPRSGILDELSNKPFLRKVVQRLPRVMRPRALPYTHVIAIDGDGNVLMNLQDPEARAPSLTGVYETRSALYLTTLFGNELFVLSKDYL